MTVHEFLFPALRAWVEVRRESLAAEGVALDLDESRSGWVKASIALAVDGPDAVGQLTVWENGEAELEYGAVATGQVVAEHRSLASVEDLHRALDDLVRLQHEGPGRP